MAESKDCEASPSSTAPLIPPDVLARLGSRLYRVVIMVRQDLKLSDHPGVTLRGGFGYALKDLICTEQNVSCVSCPQRYGCAYSYLFETPVPPDLPARRVYDKAPHPFVFDLEATHDAVPAGGEYSISLLLIGHAVGHLPTCLLALSRLGRRGLGKKKIKFRIEKVLDEDDGGDVFGPGGTVQLRAPKPFEPGDTRKAERVSVSFLTPVQFRSNGKVAREISFHLLVRNLLRRLSLLSFFHAGFDPPIDYQGIIRSAEAIEIEDGNLFPRTIRRYSSRQKRRIPMDCLAGTVTYSGSISPFLPLLEFGKRFHAGRGVSFGMGRMDFEIIHRGRREKEKS